MHKVRVLFGLFAAMAMVLSVSATAFAGNEDKVGICHRTAAPDEVNPYVYIEVDDSAADTGDKLSDHLGNNDAGHKAKTWDEDGIWRGVPHQAGDPRDDYLAPGGKSDCDDFVVTTTDESSTTSTDETSSTTTNETSSTSTNETTTTETTVTTTPNEPTPPATDTIGQASSGGSGTTLLLILAALASTALIGFSVARSKAR